MNFSRSKSSALNFLLIIFCQLFLSSMTHAAWQPLNQGLQGVGRVSAFAFDPQNKGVLYAGTFFGGLYKSTDDAVSWQAIGDDYFPGDYIADIVINPKNTAEIYVTTEKKGIYKTTDGGGHWQAINTGLGTHSADYLVLNPQNPQEVYVTSFQKGFYKSTNGGANWTKITKGLQDADMFSRMAIDPLKPNILLMQSFAGFFEPVFYKSVDSGASWQEVKLDNDMYLYQMDFAKQDAQTVYAASIHQLLKSTDAGNTWSPLLTTARDDIMNAYAINQDNPAEIYAHVEHQGFFKTQDGGKNWQLINKAYANKENWVRLFLNPFNTQELFFISGNDGLYRSQDAGSHWQSADNGLFNLDILTLAADLKNPKRMYAGTVLHGLWITEDGEHWVKGDEQFSQHTIQKIAIDPNNPANLVMIVNKDPSTLRAYVYRSTDYGKTWQLTLLKLGKKQRELIPSKIIFNPVNSREIYISGYFEGIYKSTDGGQSWFEFYNNNYGAIYDLVINPINPNEMFYSTEDFEHGDQPQLVYKSVDAGKNWQALPQIFAGNAHLSSHMYALKMDPTNPQVMYGAVGVSSYPYQLKLYKTIDGGQTWAVVGNGLPSSEFVSAILIDPNNSQTLYISTGYYYDAPNLASGKGVYVSHDGGLNWQPLNDGLVNPFAISLMLSDKTLFVGTQGSGVFEMDVN